jgi:hypothetical protein
LIQRRLGPTWWSEFVSPALSLERALGALRAILSELGLTLKDAKTRIVELREGGEGLDFLGFHHRWVRGNTPA